VHDVGLQRYESEITRAKSPTPLRMGGLQLTSVPI